MLQLDLSIPISTLVDFAVPWPRQMRPRQRLQRSFDAWYRTNEHRLLIKLEFIRRSDSCLHFAFRGVNRAIDATLSYDLSVHVTWENTWWDELISLDTYPRRVAGGYICTECDPATRPTFPSREALWEYELFEPFLQWVNENLAPANALHLYGVVGMTTAKLIKREPNRCEHFGVPIES